MIVKMNRKSRGRKGVVEYLLNEREKKGTALTLRGNPEITRSLIKTNERKHKYLSGGLMFAKEEHLNAKQKKQIMNDFEGILFAGISSNQYNILWVEHHDKGRLELNFVVPRIELSRGIDLDLYSHSRDLPLFDMWKNGINIKYGLVDPNDPRRARTMTERTKVARGEGSIVANRKTLDETLHKLVSSGQINNREQMLELLAYSGYEITRKSSENISVKHKDIGKKALRLKGGIYSEKFKGTRNIESISKERERQIREYDNKVAREDIISNRSTYQKYLQTRIGRNQKRYSNFEQSNKSKSQDIEKGDNEYLVATTDNENKRMDIDDRIRNIINTSYKEREDCNQGFGDREDQLFKQIENSNIKLSRKLGKTEQTAFGIYEKSREDVETNIDQESKGIDTKISNSNGKKRNNTDRVYEIYERINEQFSRLKISIEGVINEIKKLKLFTLAKQDVVSENRSTKRVLRRR